MLYGKLLVFALLGTTLVLADSAEVPDNEVIDRSEFASKLSEWAKSVSESLSAYLARGRQNFGELVAELKKESRQAAELSKEKAAELREKYEDFRKKAQRRFEEERRVWSARVAESLRRGREHFEKAKEASRVAFDELYAKWREQYQNYKEAIKAALAERNETPEDNQ
ncbi:uncharacterized protein LOC106637264 [Copidosoma floridanum]|uniref:uncharacterized protein LOC106637264 n=1 Tax=Copidosoma floridanum TaxID=29053 RepID=UPI0006C9B8DA|nr:uncharacterized protein LOC106637264 [Copidosoma floridanum]